MAIIASTIVGVFEAGKPSGVDLVLPIRVPERFAHEMNDRKDDQFRRDRQDQPCPKHLLPKRQFHMQLIRIGQA
jgi:hypothetical protein